MSSPSGVVAAIPVGMEPRWVTIAPDGDRAYVTMTDLSPTRGAVEVIDTRSNTLLATMLQSRVCGSSVAATGGQEMRRVDLHDTTFATHHVGDVVYRSDATGRSARRAARPS